MVNSSKIRTMQDDLSEADNKVPNEKFEELKNERKLDENIKNSTANRQAEKHSSPVIESVVSENKVVNTSYKNNDDKKNPVISNPSVIQSNDKLHNTQDDQLAKLIEIANSENDKDIKDESQVIIDKKPIISSQNTNIENDKDASLRKIIEDQNNKETNGKDIDKDELKTLISRISKPSIVSKDNSTTGDKKNEQAVVKENSRSNISDKTEIISEKTKPIPVVSVETVKDIVQSNKEEITNDPQDINQVPQSNFNNTKQVIASISSEKNVLDKEEVVDKKENHKKFQWKDFTKKIDVKTSENKIDKIDGVKKKATAESKKNDEINVLSSGLLKVKRDEKKEKDPKFVKKGLLNSYNENYVSPSERLIHGKQEMYSSVSKTVKQKNDNDDIRSLKESERITNERASVLSKDEEYIKLKRGIIQKYNIKFSVLPWKKIIPMGLIFIFLIGAAVWFNYIPRLKIDPIIEPPVVGVVEYGIDRFVGIEEIIREKNSLVGLYNPNNDDEIKFNEGIKVIKLKIVDSDKNNNALTLQDTLNIILKKDESVFSDGFFEEITGSYNIFVFETKKGTIRYGLAIETKEDGLMYNVMKRWEADGTNSTKMIAVFRNLFIDDAAGNYLYKPFVAVDLNGVEINYAHLEDKDAALNYFIHNNILVITTSMDNNSTMVDLVRVN